MLVLCIPNFLALYDILQNGKESLRYVWVQRDLDQTIEMVNWISEKNGREQISREELRDLMEF